MRYRRKGGRAKRPRCPNPTERHGGSSKACGGQCVRAGIRQVGMGRSGPTIDGWNRRLAGRFMSAEGARSYVVNCAPTHSVTPGGEQVSEYNVTADEPTTVASRSGINVGGRTRCGRPLPGNTRSGKAGLQRLEIAGVMPATEYARLCSQTMLRVTMP